MIYSGQEDNSRMGFQSYSASVFSLMLAVALILQSSGGLLIKGLYRDNAWLKSIFFPTDLVTLVVVVPVLIGALVKAGHGSARALLVWVGALYYVLYNNLYYLLGSAYNRFFLVYAAILILSAGALLAILTNIAAGQINAMVNPGFKRKPVCLVMFFGAAILGLMWVGQNIVYNINGQIPQLIIDTKGITHMIAALDLTMIVPLLTLGAIWLWKSDPWGYVISTAMLVQCAIITVVLIVAAPFQEAAGVKDAWSMVPLWFLMGVGFWVSSWLMIRNINTPSRKQLNTKTVSK